MKQINFILSKITGYRYLLNPFLFYLTTMYVIVVLTNLIHEFFWEDEDKLLYTFNEYYLHPLSYFISIAFIYKVFKYKISFSLPVRILITLLSIHLLYYFIFIETIDRVIWDHNFMRGLSDSTHEILPFLNYYLIPFCIVYFIVKKKFNLFSVFVIYWLSMIIIYSYFHLTNYYHWHGLRLDRIWNMFEFDFQGFYYQMKYALITQMLVLLFDLFTFRLLLKPALNPNLKQING